jgi:prevent-host-death family protein
METIGSYQAKTHLPQLLERVARGESFVITKHGVPIARLVPVEEEPKLEVEQAIQQLLEFRKRHRLAGLTIKELINEGRQV